MSSIPLRDTHLRAGNLVGVLDSLRVSSTPYAGNLVGVLDSIDFRARFPCVGVLDSIRFSVGVLDFPLGGCPRFLILFPVRFPVRFPVGVLDFFRRCPRFLLRAGNLVGVLDSLARSTPSPPGWAADPGTHRY